MQRTECLRNKVRKSVAARKNVGMWLFEAPSCIRKCKIYIRNISTGSASWFTIQKNIFKEINQSPLSSLMIDETTDVFVTQKLMFYFCYILNDGNIKTYTVQKMKFSIKDFYSKSDQICSFLRIWLNLLKKPLMENFIFLCCALFGVIVPISSCPGKNISQ